MNNGQIALEGLLDFINRAENDYSVPDDMYALARMLVDLIGRNDYEYASEYYMRHYEEVDELKFDYLTERQSIALGFWMDGK